MVGDVDELVADADLLHRDEQVFRPHLDLFGVDVDQPARPEFGGGVVGDGGNG
ncbi:hypothetical protein D3C83_134230 [compost metagenome]